MRMWRVGRALTMLLVLVVLVISGIYLIVYLYRWEWNRAQISGMFFVAALVTMLGALVLRGIQRVEARLDRLDADASSRDELTELLRRTNAERPRHRFDWLRDESGRTGVFVPVLLGAGIIVSFVTYVIEHLAGWLVGPTLDRRTSGLVTLDLPLGVPLDRPAPPPPARTSSEPRSAALRSVGWGVSAAVIIALVVAGIDVIGDATQSRPETSIDDGRHALVLEFEQQRTARPVEQLAEALTVACSNRLPNGARVESIDVLDPDRVIVVIDHRLGELAERRYAGCLEDATLDLARARLVRP